MDLSALSAIANIASAAAVVVAIAFGVVQIRLERRRRDESNAVELVRTLLSDEILQAHSWVFTLPDDFDRQKAAALGPDDAAKLRRALFFYENVGLLVHRRVVRVDVVADLVDVTVPWRKLEAYVMARRPVAPRSWEWFQWLAEHVHQVDEPPAYVAHRDWRP